MDRPNLAQPARPAAQAQPSTEVVARPPPAPRGAGRACLVQIYPTNEGLGARHPIEDEPILIGRDPKCHICIADPSVSAFHAHLVRKDGDVHLNDYRSTNGTFVNDQPIFLTKLNDGDYVRIGQHIFRFLGGDNIESLFHEEISRLVVTDALTGCASRRAVTECLQREVARAQRYARPLSILMIDVDHFKSINDERGHLAGDAVLRELATRLMVTVRKEEMLGRLGGDEFLLILPECSGPQGAEVGHRLRMLVAGRPFKYLGASFKVTISIGIASIVGTEVVTSEGMLERADGRLYLAKEEGRNRVVEDDEH